jgi:hypothetical protein
MKTGIIVYGENSGIIEKMRAKSLIFPVLLTLIERGEGEGGGRNGGNVTVWSHNQEPSRHKKGVGNVRAAQIRGNNRGDNN